MNLKETWKCRRIHWTRPALIGQLSRCRTCVVYLSLHVAQHGCSTFSQLMQYILRLVAFSRVLQHFHWLPLWYFFNNLMVHSCILYKKIVAEIPKRYRKWKLYNTGSWITTLSLTAIKIFLNNNWFILLFCTKKSWLKFRKLNYCTVFVVEIESCFLAYFHFNIGVLRVLFYGVRKFLGSENCLK